MVATDVGGTCTDAVLFAAGEPVRLGKALSTPPDFADGVLAAVAVAADSIGLGTDALLARDGALRPRLDGGGQHPAHAQRARRPASSPRRASRTR